ncbi:uncharacterized protein LOC129618726 [Condylostylus longicornis]|uniref:uncharacterized protein LOC129618726 n=1 Tax=Condylostylus longicornis TaxID=2530218 RepID=UPI00244E5749|nr:uncharacterized protein LOC129618726 [Condylostylus longicornis]
MLTKLFWCHFVLVAFLSFEVFGQECRIDFKKDLTSKSPVFLKNGKLQTPLGQYLKWNTGEESNLVCNGPKNLFINENINTVRIKCNNNILTVNGRRVDLKKLECNSISTGDVRTTNKKCEANGNILEIGFDTQNDGFVKYIEVCYNLKSASVVYTRHTIPGAAIDYSISESARPTFSTKGMPKHVRPNTSYKQSNELERLTNLLGARSAKGYIKPNSFLARGHLSPDKDGIFRGWQFATYMYVNVAPQWQTINAINWLKVENLARKKAALLNDNLEIVTGVSGLLSLQNDRGQYVQITLENDGNIRVPEYFWKILKYKNSAIAFVTLNNPFEYTKPFCTDICGKYGWPTSDFDIVEKGLTFCCSTIELSNAFRSDVPKDMITKSILKF